MAALVMQEAQLPRFPPPQDYDPYLWLWVIHVGQLIIEMVHLGLVRNELSSYNLLRLTVSLED